MAWINKPTNFAIEVLKDADDHLKKIVGDMRQNLTHWLVHEY